MAATAELKKIKLNINNIRSVLLDGKKTVDEKQKERQDFLDKLEEDRKQSKEEKGLEKLMKPTKKPQMKSPVKSASSLVDKMFAFVGAILGGILVNALPGIIDAIKKVVEKVKPIFTSVVEGLKPVFEFISGFMPEMGAYDADKAQADADIAEAQKQSDIIGKENDELGLVNEDVQKANNELDQSASDLGVTNKMLGDEKTSEAYSDDKEKTDNKMVSEDSQTVVNKNIQVEEGVTDEGLKPTGGETNSTVESVKSNETLTDNGLVETGDSDVASSTDLSNVTVVKAPLAPQRSDYPETALGLSAYMTAKKQYVIEEKKRQKNLIKPSTKNNNGITALNNTDGLTTINGSSSKTVVLQRQVVEKIVTVPV